MTNIVTMVWVSNHTSEGIAVSITNKTGGSNDTYIVSPCIPYKSETKPHNWWARSGSETLKAIVNGKGVTFTVNKDDHVTFYEDTYEIFTAKWAFF
jgi:hypothetical protein